ncbi:hypothetical protein [Coralliovum pocilloporae]|uniref:hypothetical protein n=1 Tax=Coralliovum pocilloporae TaxID=3066369 RepID=UPI003307765C
MKLSKALICSAFALAACLSTGLMNSEAQAQRGMPCAARADMIGLLKDRYKEAPRAVGLISSRGVMEVYVSQEGTWSILMTSAKGKTCIIAAGKNWEELQLAFKEPAA